MRFLLLLLGALQNSRTSTHSKPHEEDPHLQETPIFQSWGATLNTVVSTPIVGIIMRNEVSKCLESPLLLYLMPSLIARWCLAGISAGRDV
jgi:hypothetical protein